MRLKKLFIITFAFATIFFISCREEISVEPKVNQTIVNQGEKPVNKEEIKKVSEKLEKDSKALENELNELENL